MAFLVRKPEGSVPKPEGSVKRGFLGGYGGLVSVPGGGSTSLGGH